LSLLHVTRKRRARGENAQAHKRCLLDQLDRSEVLAPPFNAGSNQSPAFRDETRTVERELDLDSKQVHEMDPRRAENLEGRLLGRVDEPSSTISESPASKLAQTTVA
jgi:hypothetical protein